MMKSFARLNDKGLTLIELLAVLVILGIIAAIATASILSLVQNSRDKAFVGNAYALNEAAGYFVKREVTSGNALAQRITFSMVSEAGFMEAFKDPYTGNYIEPSDASYVEIDGEHIRTVCLYGENRNLCSYQGASGKPIPVRELSIDLIVKDN